ncbi:cbb3-type cytochrome oxidase assembly protein CcoS [Ostreibacterium oceani]|uniref:Cbb3-type cytochrome oxidase assembly protein CcoS n=1 Tax=Ostreibacterium oceani TaxID=2654998 RepID=A0A6N7F2I6_9GAMM|nr:cbb3-type cytochrome oxidase assembly protein CcoS [Ostreibacterium oceani]MPV86086.1 cbb3-type cytochrome oxidase assembly protein CcoS [Ostreibacterium oceani]
MSILYVLIPLTITLLLVAVYAFFWAVNHQQFDDLDSPAYRVLLDDDSDAHMQGQAQEEAQKEAQKQGQEQKQEREQESDNDDKTNNPHNTHQPTKANQPTKPLPPDDHH